jgi:hypothetical protein
MTIYAGFDRSEFPGLPVMRWLEANTNLAWCGFYLAPSPSHQDPSWMGSRDALVALGFGLAPIFVGQETMGPGSHNVTAYQGSVDGAAACKLMARAGFPHGSFVYLDMENPDLPHQGAYIAAWCDAVVAGGFMPGVYTSFEDAAGVHALRPAARLWVYHVQSVEPHGVPGTVFATPDPAASGFAGAIAWQHTDSAIIGCSAAPGGTLLVDLDSASMPDPSAPLVPVSAIGD